MFEELTELTRRLGQYLTSREDQMRCFHAYASQVEGWFKGELLCFLDQEKKAGRLLEVEREKLVRVSDKRISVDFLLRLKAANVDSLCWIEIKHWYIGIQNGVPYGSEWYFKTARHSACVRPDLEKLSKIPDSAARTMLILTTKNPGVQDWNSGIEAFNAKFAPLSVGSLTTPGDYPDYFFLGLLYATRGRDTLYAQPAGAVDLAQPTASRPSAPNN